MGHKLIFQTFWLYFNFYNTFNFKIISHSLIVPFLSIIVLSLIFVAPHQRSDKIHNPIASHLSPSLLLSSYFFLSADLLLVFQVKDFSLISSDSCLCLNKDEALQRYFRSSWSMPHCSNHVTVKKDKMVDFSS